MRVRRAHVPSLGPVAPGSLHRPDDALRRRLLGALRARPGDRFILFSRDREADAVLRVDGALEILAVRESPAVAGTSVTLLLPLMKGPRIRDAVRQSVEVGVDRIVPVECERSVRELVDPARLAATIAAVAGQAAQQCGARPPEIAEPAADVGRAAEAAASCNVKLYLDPAADRLLDGLPAPPDPPRAIALFTGPEGGFAPAETARLDGAGFTGIRLRANVLRCETAPPVALALLRQHFKY